jgi:tetratricopeptide (TPR) repeat protein
MEYLSRQEQAELQAQRLTNSFVDDTLRQLDRIWASRQFERVHHKAKDFLGYVMAKKILGHEDDIKETLVAIKVYGEGADYDPTENTKIRVAAGDLRQRLIEYYAGEGQRDAIEISIPTGTYVPEIRERRPTIAVSLFENWNPAEEPNYLCLTVTDDIAHRLTHSGAIQARRVSALEPSDQPLHYGLRGSLESLGDGLKIHTSVSDLYAPRIIFSQTFEGQRDDLFKLSRKVAAAILSALHPQNGYSNGAGMRLARERFGALQLYQQGRFHLRRRTAADIRRAIDFFEQAIESNEEYALAYSGLADCHLVLSWYALSTPDRAWFEAAKAHALRAVELNPRLPEARTSLGDAKLLCDFDWAGAEQEFRQALLFENRYAPAHHWYAELLAMQGRFSEAEEEMKRAFHLDPGSIVIRKSLGDPCYYSRRYPEAIDRYRAALQIDPSFWMAHLFLGWAYQQTGETSRALAEFEAVAACAGISSIVQGALGHLYATSGEELKALSIIERLKEQPGAPYLAPHTLAVIYAGLGDKDRAFEWLEASYENRIELLAWIKVDPRFDALRADSRLDRFLARIGLYPAGRDLASEI